MRSIGEVCIQYGGGVHLHTVCTPPHTVYTPPPYCMHIQYGRGVHTVWRCAYSMGEVCIQYGGGVHTVWGGVQRFRSISKTGCSALFEFPRNV